MRLDASPKRAAQYVRMSTERQDNSILQQKAAIATYASSRGYQVAFALIAVVVICRTILKLKGRP